MAKMSNEDALNTLIFSPHVNPNLISDGYHTFGELYRHRIALFKALCRILSSKHILQVWKSKNHSDGTEIQGWFILGIGTAKGNQITYHLPDSEWLNTDFVPVLNRALEYDGHTSDDVIDRLNALM